MLLFYTHYFFILPHAFRLIFGSIFLLFSCNTALRAINGTLLFSGYFLLRAIYGTLLFFSLIAILKYI